MKRKKRLLAMLTALVMVMSIVTGGQAVPVTAEETAVTEGMTEASPVRELSGETIPETEAAPQEQSVPEPEVSEPAAEPKTEATEPVTEPKTEAAEPVTEPRTEAAELVTEAKTEAAEPVTEPRTEAAELVTEAKTEATEPATEQKTEAAEPVTEAKTEASEAVTETGTEGTAEPVTESKTEASDSGTEDSEAGTEASGTEESGTEAGTESESEVTEQLTELDTEETEELTENESESETESESESESETEQEGEVTYLPVSQPAGVNIVAYAQAGVFPEGTQFYVSNLTEDAEAKAEAALTDSGVEFDGFYGLDLTFKDKDGKEIEPEDGKVRIEFGLDARLLPDEADLDTLEVQHLVEEKGAVVEVETVADTADAAAGVVEADESVVAAEFEVSSFSTITVSWQDLKNPYAYPKNTVNFYVNLISKIANSAAGGNSSDVDKSNFTTSVYSTTVREHPDRFECDNSEAGSYIVIQGDNDGSAYNADLLIRSLAPTGNGYEGFKIAGFPSDEDVFSTIRSNWNDVTKNEGLNVGGVSLGQADLTIENYAIRWYVFKYNETDAWHIDGILVPKYGRLTVTKTFVGANSILDSLDDSFEIGVRARDHAHSYTLTLDSENQNIGVRGYDSKTVNGDSTTYTWTIDVYSDTYTVTENNGNVAGWQLNSAVYSTMPDSSAGSNSNGAYPEGGFSIPCVTRASDAGTASQSCSLTNTYVREKRTVTVEKLVDGNMGDTTKEFNFSYSVNGTSGGSFTLKSGDTHKIEVNYGDAVTVTEGSNVEYVTSWTEVLDGGTSANRTGANSSRYASESAGVTNNVTVTFTNQKNVVPPTGLMDYGLPFAVMVMIALAAAAGFFLLRRRDSYPR